MRPLTRALQQVPAFPHARPSFLRGPVASFLSTSSRPSLPLPSARNLDLRTMSSAPAKKEFLCILPDKPGAQAKRLEVRP